MLPDLLRSPAAERVDLRGFGLAEVREQLARMGADEAPADARAVLGRDVPLALVAATLDQPVDRCLPLVDEAVAHGLLDRDADRLAQALDMAAYQDRALSRREAEVAGLVAEGLTNRQIAERLVISERTAQNHVQHILTKLGFTTRSRIAAWSARKRD